MNVKTLVELITMFRPGCRTILVVGVHSDTSIPRLITHEDGAADALALSAAFAEASFDIPGQFVKARTVLIRYEAHACTHQRDVVLTVTD